MLILYHVGTKKGISMFIYKTSPSKQSSLRAAITDAYRMDETLCVEQILKAATLPEEQSKRIESKARQLVTEVRTQRLQKSGLDAFMYHYDLSSEEGIALMCLAEALLRVPDKETIDHLIRDKLTSANWEDSLGSSDSFFVNAATWGLILTGKIYGDSQSTNKLTKGLKSFLRRSTGPVVRKSVGEVMKVLGRQFVMGRTIQEAVKNAVPLEKIGYRYSYDMLGEAARTEEDAQRYLASYSNAINTIGGCSNGKGEIEGPGISVKLSALHPRYEFSQKERVLPIMIDRVMTLALLAKEQHIGFTIDAEEADRLDFSLDIIEAVFGDARLKGWEGFGLAIQCYQKRALSLIDYLADLARKHKRRIKLRLVKGAYWDSEIKDSQVNGLEGYPVFTRKASTDVCYLACAKKVIAMSDAFYPQFATHNAHTAAAIMELMDNRGDYEFQCLHGMGRPLYDQIVNKNNYNIPCRIYAPVGVHEDLLPYLVRRLLENGANTSFVNRIVDEEIPIKDIIVDPIGKVDHYSIKPHTKIPLPKAIYGEDRQNSRGIDLTHIDQLDQLAEAMNHAANNVWEAKPTYCDDDLKRKIVDVIDPSDHSKVVGKVTLAEKEDVDTSLARATKAAFIWDKVPVEQRAELLEKSADLFEKNMPELMAIAVREAGKTIPDAVAEVREAVDFCRYYAQQARKSLVLETMPGPTGEANTLEMHGRGVMLCISPWNFPLAIFTGQVTAALAAGNAVIAKPAAQTPLIAAKAVELLHEAGFPKDVLQLLSGRASVIGDALVSDTRVSGIVFTGSTETARHINQVLANRPGPIVPFIAETGGQNAMIVDSTALAEQLVLDVVSSAFGSVGQRCSAMRVLFLQDNVADHILEMLKGAMAELHLGDPGLIETDIGPVIDDGAKKILQEHAKKMKREGELIYHVALNKLPKKSSYFAPCAFEIDNLGILKQEVFGPVLHVIRYAYDNLDQVIDSINETGFGLTLGIHSRIDERVRYIQQRVHAGNCYVNRNMIGAVVGVQPFGGEGLSGTGPKAGGPHYLLRMCKERTLTINTTAAGGNATLMTLGE